MSDHPIIWAMAKAHHEANGGPPWERLSSGAKELLYDAMHAALKVLREPSTDMMNAAAAEVTNACAEFIRRRDAGASASMNGALDYAEFGGWRAAIDKLLEVK